MNLETVDKRIVMILRRLEQLQDFPWISTTVWRGKIPYFNIMKPSKSITFQILAEPTRKTDIEWLINAPTDISYLIHKYMELTGEDYPRDTRAAPLIIAEYKKKLDTAIQCIADIAKIENLQSPEVTLQKVIHNCQEALNEITETNRSTSPRTESEKGTDDGESSKEPKGVQGE